MRATLPVSLTVLLLASAAPALAATSPGAEAATRAAIGRINATNGRVKAVVAIDPSAIPAARAADRERSARGPLFGVPVLIKDNIDIAGLPTTAGSLALAGNLRAVDAPLVARLRRAGAIVVGKTNLSEWANFRSSNSISGWSAVGGQTRNPHALDRNACGSSSGSAAAVAAGMVRVAIGTETDGSITCPAAMNGIVGLKPTVGLVSRTGVVPISASQDTAGPMTASVREAALTLTALAGTDPSDPATVEADRRRTDYAAALDAGALRGKRIGVLRFATGYSPGTDAVFEQALGMMRAAGATLVDIKEVKGRSEIGNAEFAVLLTEFKAGVNAYLATTPPQVKARSLADLIAFNATNAAAEMPLFGQDLFDRAEATKGLEDDDYLKARTKAKRMAGPEGIDKLLADNDVVALVAPTIGPAFLIDTVNGDQIGGSGAGSLAAVAGYPHLTVPMGQVRGLPVGLSFIGTAWSEQQLLNLGYAFEQAAKVNVTARFLPTVDGDAPRRK
jgi:amidase